MSRISLVVVFCLLSAAVARAAGPTLDESGFKQHVVPFLQKHCVECHGPKLSEGELKLHQVQLTDLAAGDSLTTWTNILERLATGNMPPADHPQPSRQESGRVVLWIRDQLLVVGHGAELAFPNKGNQVPHEVLFGDSETAKQSAAASPGRRDPVPTRLLI